MKVLIVGASGTIGNAVSPTVVSESWQDYGKFFPGYETVPVRKVALCYRRSIDGLQTGRIYRTGW